ncbi:LysR family transcriptional regulator substrate-binding protein [Streptomyces halobius]|uniref:LysR family transcriptional regulator substrate-binding protein n=1 Tax=Streptomyces halobius TaxID=2879846 RepID=UPI003872C083
MPAPDGVRLEPPLTEELVLVTAPGHALSAGTGRLPLAELAGHPLVSMAPANPNRRAVEAALTAAGASVAVRRESPGYAVVCASVSAGLGVAGPADDGGRGGAPAGDPPPGTTRSAPHHLGGLPDRRRRPPAADTLRALLRGAFARHAAP